MHVVQFIADNPAAALAQIHERLGPAAVVLSVRRLPNPGVSRFWQKSHRIEVLAGLPEAATDGHAVTPAIPGNSFQTAPLRPEAGPALPRWQTVSWLEAMGLLAAHADRLQTHLNTLLPTRPGSLESEWTAVEAALKNFWTPPPPLDPAPHRPHVFIGPAGSGKTTVLLKWLTLAVLTEEQSARVCRLDTNSANTADFVNVHCEMLGVPVDRFWSDSPRPKDLTFIDLPGAESGDTQAMAGLRDQLRLLPSPRIHLVLNAAYETSVLLRQWRAFSALNPEDMIFTHLDEEGHRVKLWNFVFGTNCSLRFLSAGQKIPGEFQPAAPRLLFPVKSQL